MVLRPIYDLMKEKGISTLQLKRMLYDAGIDIPQRTLHTYLETNFNKCTEDYLKSAVHIVVSKHNETIESLKEIVWTDSKYYVGQPTC